MVSPSPAQRRIGISLYPASDSALHGFFVDRQGFAELGIIAVTDRGLNRLAIGNLHRLDVVQRTFRLVRISRLVRQFFLVLAYLVEQTVNATLPGWVKLPMIVRRV